MDEISTPDFTKIDPLALRFKCDNCYARGHTLERQDNLYVCSACGITRDSDFWHARFEGLAPTLTFREAAQVIGAKDPSVLRRAYVEGRLKAVKNRTKQNRRCDHLITVQELARFYVQSFGRRSEASRKKKNGK